MGRMQRRQIIHHFLVAFLCAILRGVVTITDVRLVDGPSPNEGRLEVYEPDQGWGTVCFNGWDITDTTVVCGELGFPGANAFLFTDSPFGPGIGPILINNVDCSGNENSLNGCTFTNVTTGCLHQRDIGIICQKPGYLGCFGDSFARVFQDAFYADTVGMTIDACLAFCRDQNLQYAGLEYSSECYCAQTGTEYDVQGTFADSDCQYICYGYRLERCGGLGRISVFDTTVGFCNDPGVPEYGTREGNWFRYGATVTFSCAEGYTLIGNETGQCLSSAGSVSVAWDVETPVCIGPTTISTTLEATTEEQTTQNTYSTGFITTKSTDISEEQTTQNTYSTGFITTKSTGFSTKSTSSTRRTTILTTQTDLMTTEDTTEIETSTGSTDGATSGSFTTSKAITHLTSAVPTTSEITVTTSATRTTATTEVPTTTVTILTEPRTTIEMSSVQGEESTSESVFTSTVDSTSLLTSISTTDVIATSSMDTTEDMPTRATGDVTGTLHMTTSDTTGISTKQSTGGVSDAPITPAVAGSSTPSTGSQGSRWPWPPVGIGLLLGGIILGLLLIGLVICLIAISPRAKAKRKEEDAVRLRNARQSPVGNSYSPDIVLDRNGQRSYRSRNGIHRIEESEGYDNDAYAADNASIISVYGERQRAVENPYATFGSDDTSKRKLFAATARKLNQIYVPGSPNGSLASRGTGRSSNDRYGAQLVV